jgi:N-acetylglucosamine-6-phosphate deacetylase
MSAAGMPDGTYTLGTFQVQVADGRAMSNGSLAGSVLTMDRAVANLQRFTGSSLGTAVRLASHNPAKLLGMEDVIANPIAGQPADFNVFNAAGEHQATILNGVRIQSSI